MTITRTYSGLNVNLLAPQPETINARDIAHHLALINRFAGASNQPYSVAQHSLLVAKILEEGGQDEETQLWGLLHDAHEAYLGDMPTPAKQALFGPATSARFYNVPSARDEVEGLLDAAIRQSFGLPAAISTATLAAIKAADSMALATEWRDLMQGPLPQHLAALPRRPKAVIPMDWKHAEINLHIEINCLHRRFLKNKPHGDQ